MGKPIENIEGIGPAHAAALRDAGIDSVEKLLEACYDKKGRSSLARQTQIPESRILKWVNHADLFRIDGVAGQYAELLEGAGVDTVKELRHRTAANLAAAMYRVNTLRKLVRSTPSTTIVSAWVEQARDLPPKVTH